MGAEGEGTGWRVRGAGARGVRLQRAQRDGVAQRAHG